MNQFFPFIIPVIVAIMVVASVAEMAFSGMWLPAYFRYGIPLFRQEYPLTTMPDLAAAIPELEQKLKRSAWRPAIVFRVLDRNEIAFRSSFGSKNTMSGLIRLEPSQGRMQISGHLYWTLLLIPLVFLAIAFNSPMPIFFLLFMLAIFVLTFGMQRYHYGQIAAVIAETAVTADPVTQNNSEPSWTEPATMKPDQPVTYTPDFDPYQPAKPQTGLNYTEITLLILLVALILIAGVLAFLFLV